MKLLILVLLGAVYVGGVWKFWTGYNRTNFSQGRVVLALLWPVLLFNPSYRSNFRKALRG
jgi:hypothetical protein